MGEALSDERLAEIRASICRHMPKPGIVVAAPAYPMVEIAADLLAYIDDLTAERQEIDVRAAMGEDALLRVTAERDAAQEALAEVQERLHQCREYAELISKHWHDSKTALVRATLAAARPAEPTGDGGPG